MKIYTPFDADFQCECNGSIFRRNGQELTKIYSNYMTHLKKTERVPNPRVKSPKPVTRLEGTGLVGV